MLNDTLKFLKSTYEGFKPRVGLVLGSGLNILAERLTETRTIPYGEIPGFSSCAVQGHKGALLLGKLAGVPVACLQGRAHYYEGNTHAAIQTPIRALRLWGCETLLLTNAAASLRQEVLPGRLVVIEDHLNFQFQNPLIGPNDDALGPRFPSLQHAYDPDLIKLALETGKALGIDLVTGIYLSTLGPTYETPAEIRAFKMLGAHVVGMSTVPEVIVARHCGLKVLTISTITNMGCGMSEEFLTHERVLEMAQGAAHDLSELIVALAPKL